MWTASCVCGIADACRESVTADRVSACLIRWCSMSMPICKPLDLVVVLVAASVRWRLQLEIYILSVMCVGWLFVSTVGMATFNLYILGGIITGRLCLL